MFYEDLVRDPVAGFSGIFTACDAIGEIRLDKWRDDRNGDRIECAQPSVAETAGDMGYSIT